MVQSYGIPEADAALSALSDGVLENAVALRDVAVGAALPIATTISDNATLLKRIPAAIKRQIGTVVKANNGELATVSNAIDAHLQSAATAVSSELATALAGIGSDYHVTPSAPPPQQTTCTQFFAPTKGQPYKDGWYVVVSKADGQYYVQYLSGTDLSAFQLVSGPYNSQADANVCQQSAPPPPPPPPGGGVGI